VRESGTPPWDGGFGTWNGREEGVASILPKAFRIFRLRSEENAYDVRICCSLSFSSARSSGIELSNFQAWRQEVISTFQK
jgi:hypothetical protein